LFKTAKKDYVILNLDLKNAELWLVGYLANEMNIMNAFANGEDIHSSAAVNMFNLPCRPDQVKEFEPERRQHAKTVNFAILYMAGPGRIADELGISFGEAKNLIDTWFRAYPNVKIWLDNEKAKIVQTGIVETVFGRSREVEDLNAVNKWVREHGIKSAINMKVQSPASDINLMGYCKGIKEIRDFGYRFTPFALVHDSIVGECHKDDIVSVVATFRSAIQSIIKYWVPIGVDAEYGPSWGEMEHEV
jgi:DNA polymerase-1